MNLEVEALYLYFLTDQKRKALFMLAEAILFGADPVFMEIFKRLNKNTFKQWS